MLWPKLLSSITTTYNTYRISTPAFLILGDVEGMEKFQKRLVSCLVIKFDLLSYYCTLHFSLSAQMFGMDILLLTPVVVCEDNPTHYMLVINFILHSISWDSDQRRSVCIT